MLGKNQVSGYNTLMDSTIQTLLNGYLQPAFLADASDRSILFLNNAAQEEFGFPLNQSSSTTLQDLFSSRKIIKQGLVWQRNKGEFEFHEEKFKAGNQEYILTVAEPIEKEGKPVDLFELQKDIARLIVHRFHSPLNGISGFTELLKNTDLDKKQSSYIDSIEKGLEDFKEILSEIKELADEPQVQYSRFNAEKFGKSILSQYPADQKNRIELSIDSEVTELHSDFVLLQKIIAELLKNALQFSTPTNGIVRLHFREDNIIRVTNYGKQIPASFVNKMFYPFYSNKARGIGIGLSKATYFARELGYEIVLAQNSSTEGISFDIRM